MSESQAHIGEWGLNKEPALTCLIRMALELQYETQIQANGHCISSGWLKHKHSDDHPYLSTFTIVNMEGCYLCS